MPSSVKSAFMHNFLGNSADWYKYTILAFLVINPLILLILPSETGPTVASWCLVLEFIFTLAMALKCYPLQPGGLLVIEAMLLRLTTPDSLEHEVFQNFPVILLLMFMVAGIYFMKDLLLFIFTKILIGVRSKLVLSLLFSIVSAVLSAFLDALTVTAVIISVAVGFYTVYHKVASGKKLQHLDHNHHQDDMVIELHRSDLEQFRAFLRNLMMHAAIGTALGGVCTVVGEPQNLLIAEKVQWEFVEFFLRMAPVTMPVFVAGLLTLVVLEKTGWFGYGATLPVAVREILTEHAEIEAEKRNNKDIAALIVQALAGIILMLGLAFHVAEVGFIGLLVIVLITAFTGIIEEHQLGKAFEEALPFTSLLVVFFGIVAVIHDQHLFTPIINAVLEMDKSVQPGMFFLANGILSMISDNVFVATVYINEVVDAYKANLITRDHLDMLAIAINTGTNLPSVATPNGQAAFLFLLTSALAPLIRLSYGRMVIMALPYTIVLTIVGYICVSTLI